MLKEFARNTSFFAATALAATIGGLSASLVISGRGDAGPAILASGLMSGGLAILIALVASAIIGIVVTRITNTAVGLFACGGGLFGLSFRLDTVRELAFGSRLIDAAGGAPVGLTNGPGLVSIAIETAIWAGLILAAVLFVFKFGGALKDVEPDDSGRNPHPLSSPAAWKMAAAGLIMLPVVWFAAQSDAKGQAIGAVFAGGMACGLAGRLISPHVQPILLFASPVLAGAIGHVVALVLLKDQSLIDAYVSGSLAPLARPMPVDYAAGSMMGVAVGLGWAKSFLHHEAT